MTGDNRETRDEVVQLGPFVEGVDNLHPEYEIPPNRLRNAVNVDLPDTGNPVRRKGVQRVLPVVSGHSFWSNGRIAMLVEAGTLKLVSRSAGGIVATTLRAGVGNRPMSYDEFNGEVLYSNGLVTGKIVDEKAVAWGVGAPPNAPSMSAGSGGLAAGLYQATVTYANDTGEESGAPLPAQIDAAEGSSITISGIPTPADPAVTRVRIYVSPANGEELYRQAELLPGTSTFSVYQVATGRPRLRTTLLSAPPPGDIVRAGFGRLWIASGPMLWFTEAFSSSHVNASRNFIRFPADVSVVQPVSDGIHIVADRHYFLPSGNPAAALVKGPAYGAVIGTGIYMNNGKAGAWMSTRGFVIGGPGGEVTNIQEARVAVDPMARGSVLFREEDGMRQLVGAFSDGEQTALAARSFIRAEVVRRKDLS